MRNSRMHLLPLIGITVLALIATACGGSDDDADGDSDGGAAPTGDCVVDALEGSDSPVDVTVWHGFSGLAARTLDELADAYNESQSEVVVTVEPQGTYEEQLKKFTDSLRDPDSLPDIYVGEDTNTQFMIDSQTAIPAAACIEADPDSAATYDDLLASVDAGYTVDGTLWPAAFGVSTPLLYYNKDHFSAAGLDTETPPRSLAEIRSAAEALRAANPDPGYHPMVFRVDSWWLEHLDTRAGEALVDQNNGRDGLGTTSLLLNDETDAFVEWIVAMRDDGLLEPVAHSATFDAYLTVATQAGSMLLETSTAATTVDAIIEGSLNPEDLGLEEGTDLSAIAFPDLDIGVGQMPGPDGPGSGQIGGNAWYMIDTGSDVGTSASWDFIKFFLETENQVTWTERGSYLPVFERVEEDPGLQSYFTDSRPGRWLAVAFQGLQVVDPEFPGPVIGPYKEFRVEVRASLESILLNNQDPTATMEAADTNFQRALDEYATDVGAG